MLSRSYATAIPIREYEDFLTEMREQILDELATEGNQRPGEESYGGQDNRPATRIQRHGYIPRSA